jgi:AcrR family transcriptional regulator
MITLFTKVIPEPRPFESGSDRGGYFCRIGDEDKKRPSGRFTTDRPDGILNFMKRANASELRDSLLDAAETVVMRQGIANLALDAVAAEAGISKGGLLHHFPSKDRLVEAMVARSAESWRGCYMGAYERTPEGPGRMARALLDHCLSDAEGWTEELKRSSSACFAALAQNPSLIEPMRAAYSDLHQRVADDGLPPGVGEAVAAAIDGLWLYWVLGLATVDQELVVRVRRALEDMLARSQPVRVSKAKARAARRSGGRRV